MRALITGGAGFIGSHLAEALLGRGDDVFILDDLSTGSVENIRHLKASDKFHYAFDSLQNRHLLAEMVDESDVVFHLAAAVGVRLIVESPVRTIETNVNGTQLVLDAASKKKKLVLAASTSEVYGKSKEVPFHEDSDLVLGPTTKGRWSYAASKALDEFLALSYWKEKKLPVIIIRFFNTVGPRQTGRYGMVLPNFVSQALENAPITIFGTGEQSRCFCDVQDSVQAIIRLVDSGKAVGEVVNVGSNEEVTIEGLAQVVKRRTGSSSPITHTPYDEAYEPGFEDMLRRVPSLEKLERITGFRPRTSLNAIVDRVIAHFREKENSAASNGHQQEEPLSPGKLARKRQASALTL
ncbi:MAG: GDP-mannose 4,6-dehydratase [Candidatus Acidiferrales bacterium]